MRTIKKFSDFINEQAEWTDAQLKDNFREVAKKNDFAIFASDMTKLVKDAKNMAKNKFIDMGDIRDIYNEYFGKEESEIITEGTGNFYNLNASKVFAIGEGDDESEAEDNYNDSKEAVMDALIKAKFDKSSGTPNKDNRNFPGSIIARKTVSKDFGSNSVSVTICAIERQGYYQGANLDWELEYDFDGSNYKDDEEFDEENVRNAFDVDEKDKRGAQRASSAYSWAKQQAENLGDGIETIYAKTTMPLVVSARSSSGETHYKKA